jgi:hypothetical protein
MPTTTQITATLARATLAAALTTITLAAAVAPAMAETPLHRQATAARLACRDLPAKGLDTTGGFQRCYAEAMAKTAVLVASK